VAINAAVRTEGREDDKRGQQHVEETSGKDYAHIRGEELRHIPIGCSEAKTGK
jgi:hypothetical protein